MYCKRFRLLVAVAVCTTLALVTTQRPAAAEEPQTVTHTFALLFSCFPWEMDQPPLLSDFVGEDTVAILLGALGYCPNAFNFADYSPPCDGVEVAGQEWLMASLGTVVNKENGPARQVVVLRRGWRDLPAHTVLVGAKITEVHACWLRMAPNGSTCGVVAQDNWDWDTRGVFVIVTGEFARSK